MTYQKRKYKLQIYFRASLPSTVDNDFAQTLLLYEDSKHSFPFNTKYMKQKIQCQLMPKNINPHSIC